MPNPDFPLDLRVMCVNRHCEFSRGQNLPILAVDEPIYRRLPCFLIATVDKFAALPWVGEVVWLMAKIEKTLTIGEGDIVQKLKAYKLIRYVNNTTAV